MIRRWQLLYPVLYVGLFRTELLAVLKNVPVDDNESESTRT